MRVALYRAICALIRPWLKRGKAFDSAAYERSLSVVGSRRGIWAHAASAGELESLLPVLDRLIARSTPLIVTVFSESGSRNLQKWAEGLSAEKKAQLVYHGLSPFEGQWRAALDRAKPSLFLTVKYEAWPDLWCSISELQIPLYIVAARDRSSLRWIRRVLAVLGVSRPRLSLRAIREAEIAPLRELFPEADTRALGEPRWDRVSERARIGSARARSLIADAREWPRPWGILAQVWPEDLKVWSSLLADLEGSVWVVPHKVDEAHVRPIEEALQAAGKSPRRTAPEGRLQSPRPGEVILVNEVGFLAELYSAADWVFVGGGFGRDGIHSTLEPAIRGVPIACGPNRAGEFSEIAQLQETGQLRIVRNAQEIRAWLNDARQAEPRFRERWLLDARQREGASETIAKDIAGLTGLNSSC